MPIIYSPELPTVITWRSGSLWVENPPPDLLDDLTYTHKSLKPDGFGDRITVREQVTAWEEVPDVSNTIVTYQGFHARTLRLLSRLQTVCEWRDERLALPPPQLRHIKGFRGSQCMMFLQLIQKSQSGLFQAPTRYGKSCILQNLCRAWPDLTTVVAAPGVDLLGQLVSELRNALPGREVKGIFTGSRDKYPSEDITVCSLDSLGKMDHAGVKLLIVDEAHSVVSPSRLFTVSKFENARIYGLGATLSGRYDGADVLIEGVFGPVLARKTFEEAVQEKMICPIRVYLMPMQFDLRGNYNRDQAYRRLVYENPLFIATVSHLCANYVPADWQTLIFVDEKKQAGMVSRMVEESAVAVASKLGNTERKELFGKMVSNEIKRCVATDIFSTGITFPDLRVIVNAAGGGGSITGTQKPGRLAQNRPDKLRGYLVDFTWKPASRDYKYSPGVWRVALDAKARREVYEANGYEVIEVKEIDQMKFE